MSLRDTTFCCFSSEDFAVYEELLREEQV